MPLAERHEIEPGLVVEEPDQRSGFHVLEQVERKGVGFDRHGLILAKIGERAQRACARALYQLIHFAESYSPRAGGIIAFQRAMKSSTGSGTVA